MAQALDVSDLIKKFVHSLSQERLKGLSRRVDIQVMAPGFLVSKREQWSCYRININLGAIKIRFKTFYTDQSLQEINPVKSYRDPAAMIREFCNLVGGGIEQALNENFPSLRNAEGLGLPQMYHVKRQENYSEDTLWFLLWGEGKKLICHVDISLGINVWRQMNLEALNKGMTCLKLRDGGRFEILEKEVEREKKLKLKNTKNIKNTNNTKKLKNIRQKLT